MDPDYANKERLQDLIMRFIAIQTSTLTLRSPFLIDLKQKIQHFPVFGLFIT